MEKDSKTYFHVRKRTQKRILWIFVPKCHRSTAQPTRDILSLRMNQDELETRMYCSEVFGAKLCGGHYSRDFIIFKANVKVEILLPADQNLTTKEALPTKCHHLCSKTIMHLRWRGNRSCVLAKSQCFCI